MLKNLIIIEGENDYQFDTLEELVKKLTDENYYNKDIKERKKIINRLAEANKLNKDIEIVEGNNIPNVEGKIIVNDEITYVLSLLVCNIIVLLEKKDSNILVNDINVPNSNNNYIIVNKFAEKLLKKYLEKGI